MSLWSRWLSQTLKRVPFRSRPSAQEERILRLAEMIGDPAPNAEPVPPTPLPGKTEKVE